MCLRHWMLVPKDLQRAVWNAYRPGQCVDKDPSDEWHTAADAAIEAVAKIETDAKQRGGKWTQAWLFDPGKARKGNV